MRWILYLTLAMSTLWMSVAHAQPESRCKPRGKIAAYLAERYDETPLIRALTNDGNMLEIWVSEATGTWTLTVTGPSKIACVIDAGRHFQLIKQRTGRPS